MKKNKQAIILLLQIILVLGWIKSTSAEIYLASTPTEFKSFLKDAEESPDDSTIRLAAGVYDLSSGKLEYEVRTSGGNLTIEPANTGDVVILDGGSGGVLPLPEGVVASRILEITNPGGINEIITITGMTGYN